MKRYRLTLRIEGDQFPLTITAATEDREGDDVVYRDADLAEVARVRAETIAACVVEAVVEAVIGDR